MFKTVSIFILVIVFTLVISSTLIIAAESAIATHPFENLVMYAEQNATDGDMEIIVQLTGSDDGIDQLSVIAPDGRSLMLFAVPNPSILGMREFEFESPEPNDKTALKAAYPEGEYQFLAITHTGDRLSGTATLSHTLPPTTRIVSPGEEATDVPLKNAVISWEAVAGISGYILELKQDDLGVNMTAKLPASSTSFSIPDGFLLPDGEYELGVATIGQNGNISFIEASFITAAQ